MSDEPQQHDRKTGEHDRVTPRDASPGAGPKVAGETAKIESVSDVHAETQNAAGDALPQAETAPSVEEMDEALSSDGPKAEEARTAEPIGEPALSEAELEEQRQAANAQVLAVSRQHTRRSFVVAAAAVGVGVGLWRYVNIGPTENMQPLPLEDGYEFNAAVSRAVLGTEALAPTYPLSRGETLRINGIYGLKKDIVPESWRLQLVGMNDASRHPRFVPDVTAWEYKYAASPANEDKGHDTKVDPSKEAAAHPATAMLHHPEQEKQHGADGVVMSGKGKTDPTMMSSIKMAPALMLQQAMMQEAGNDNGDNNAEDDNHTGRKARGREEAGESDSTLPPHTPGLLLQLADITRLPRVEMVTQFKCIEGWSQIVHWAGVRMADFLDLYPPALIDGKEPRFVYMETPDGDYYTGYDLHAMRHPQTLLVTEMMGKPLTQKHGAPLRLHMPTKYGYKQIKRIGLIAYTNTKPDDYWTKLGYDWYAGL
jgi:hypothetical protein